MLLRFLEVDDIRKLLEAPTSDVRVAAIRTLGVLGSTQSTAAQIIKDLLAFAQREQRGPEFRSSVRAIVRCGGTSPDVHRWLFDEVRGRLRADDGTATERATDLIELLNALQRIQSLAPERLCVALMKASDNFRFRNDVKKAAVLAIGNVATPDLTTSDFLLKLLKRMPVNGKLGDSVARATRRFIERCSNRVSYIRAISPRLEQFETSIVSSYASIRSNGDERARMHLSQLRKALVKVQYALRSYREFSNRRPLE
jgi:hypothetical protein